MKLLQQKMVLREISLDLFLALITGKMLYLTDTLYFYSLSICCLFFPDSYIQSVYTSCRYLYSCQVHEM